MKALKDEVPCLDEFVENLDECGRIKFDAIPGKRAHKVCAYSLT